MSGSNIYWFSNKKNTGDLIGPWLASKILEKPLPNKPFNGSGVSLCGSILNNNQNQVNWGTGVLDKIKIRRGQNIKALRGPLTRECCISSGYNDQHHPGIYIYGDPGLLVSRYYKPDFQVKYKLGIIPHYIDKTYLKDKLKDFDLEKLGIKILNIQSNVEDFIDDLVQCQHTISSSLHGVILSVSYGIPTRWHKMGNRLGGNNIKFYDFFLSLICPTKDSNNHDLYVRDLSKYLNQKINKNYILELYPELEYFFNINFDTLNLNEDNIIKTLTQTTHLYQIPDGMLDRLIDVFPRLETIIN